MACKGNSATITWLIENYDFFCEKSGFGIFSPPFTIDMQKDTSWTFRICANSSKRKKHIVFEVNRRYPSTVNLWLELEFEIAFFKNGDSFPIYEKSEAHTFQTGSETFQCYVPQNEVYGKKRNEFWLPKILKIRCKIWAKNGFFSETSGCFARTRIRVQKTAFIGLAQKFTSVMLGEKRSLTVKSTSTEAQLLTLKLYLGDDVCCKDKVFIEIVPAVKDYIKLCKCKLFLLDSEGTKTECGGSEISFMDTETQEWKFPLNITKRFLMVKNMQFLANDTLTLKCEFAFSTGIEYERIEDCEFGNYASVNKIPSELPGALDDMTRLFEEGILCDIKLQTETETFNVQKSILSARSSVFQTMFTSNMREKTLNCVSIEDLEADTVRRMLVYLYSDKLEDMDWESAKSLYFAADKYNLASLKYRCSEFLKNNLQISDCCEVLILSDRHQDEQLKKSVQDYIALYRDAILHTEQWTNLERSNPLLIIETLKSMCLEK